MGLKLAFFPNGQVRVTSQFDLRVSFVFKPSTKLPRYRPGVHVDDDEVAAGLAQMQLIGQGTEVPEEIVQLARYWVGPEQCIPGFLASVTLECYEASKQRRVDGQ